MAGKPRSMDIRCKDIIIQCSHRVLASASACFTSVNQALFSCVLLTLCIHSKKLGVNVNKLFVHVQGSKGSDIGKKKFRFFQLFFVPVRGKLYRFPFHQLNALK